MNKIQNIPQGSVLALKYCGRHNSVIAIVAPDGTPIFVNSLEQRTRLKHYSISRYRFLEQVLREKLAKIAVSTHHAFERPHQAQSKTLPIAPLPIYQSDCVH